MRWNRLPGWSVSGIAKLAWCYLFGIGLIALTGPFLANEKPVYCKIDGRAYFPMFTNISEAALSVHHPAFSPVSWNTTAFESVIRAPIPYSHYTIDLKTGATKGPFDPQPVSGHFRHVLGTDALGRDVLAGMIRGCRVSLLIGVGSMLLALLIGLPFGAIAAYWGNRGKRISRMQFITILSGGLIILFVLLSDFQFWIKLLISVLVIISSVFIIFRQNLHGRKVIALPIDQGLLGIVSIMDGFPGLFLVIVLVAMLPYKGWVVIMLVIALLHWPIMARYVRSEVMKLKEMNYIKAAQILNLPSGNILRQHIIPFAFRPVMISFIFGIASAILAESSLSFLGIGLSPEQTNWGRLLAQARSHFDAWWLVLFPGCAIFFTLLAFYIIGNAWRKRIEINT